jgi:hypothetical protein
MTEGIEKMTMIEGTKEKKEENPEGMMKTKETKIKEMRKENQMKKENLKE